MREVENLRAYASARRLRELSVNSRLAIFWK
jgi:hypothetical protein